MNKYDYILSTDNKDKEYEYFWYGFKNSMLSYNPTPISQSIIDEYSIHLNKLQQFKEYTKIKLSIKYYILNFIDYIIKSSNLHYCNILYSNIKRWNKISSNEYTITGKDIKYCYFKLYILSLKKKNNILRDMVREYKYLEDILVYAINSNNATIIDILRNTIEVYKEINNIYNTNYIHDIRGKKILQNFNF